MKKFFQKLNISLNKDTVFRLILFLIPLFSIVLKGILFQGFINNTNP